MIKLHVQRPKNLLLALSLPEASTHRLLMHALTHCVEIGEVCNRAA